MFDTRPQNKGNNINNKKLNSKDKKKNAAPQEQKKEKKCSKQGPRTKETIKKNSTLQTS